MDMTHALLGVANCNGMLQKVKKNLFHLNFMRRSIMNSHSIRGSRISRLHDCNNTDYFVVVFHLTTRQSIFYL
jgi:hypothetical protein